MKRGIKSMKKLSYIFTTILGLLITLTIYSEFNETYYFKIDNFSNEKYVDMQVIDVILSAEDNNMNMSQLIDSLQEFAEENDTEIHIGRGKNDDLNRQVIDHFIYSSTFDVDNFIYTDEDSKVSFSDKAEDRYYALNSDDSNAIKIKVLDDYYSTGVLHSLQSYRPLYQLKNLTDDGDIELHVSFYEEDINAMNALKESLMNKYSLTNESFIQMERPKPAERAIGTNLQLIIILVVVNIILMTSYINKKLKEISIRKMNGNKNHQIMKRVIGGYISREIIVFSLAVIITYAVLVGEISPMSYNIIKPICITSIIFIIGLISVMGILYIYIRYISSLVSLKKSSVNMKLVFFNLVVKIILMAIIISPMISQVNKGIISSENLYNHLKYYDKENYRYTVSGTSKTSFNSSLEESIKISEDYFKVLEEEKGVYTDFDYSNKENAVFSFEDEIENIVPHITVNKEYLRDYEIRNEQGEIIDVDSISNNTLFIPEKYKDKEYIRMIIQDKSIEEVYVTFERPFYNPDIIAPRALSEDPSVLLVTDFAPELVQPMYEYARYGDVESLETTLKEMGYENKYRITDNSGIYDYYMKIYAKTFSKTVGIILLYVFIMLVFLYQSVYLHLEEIKKEISVKYLLGHRFWSRYSGLVIFNLSPHIILLLSAVGILKIPFNEAALFVAVFMAIEIIFLVYLIKKFEKNAVSMVLKGE
ncbi:DUF1430 domain-containing protein [Clostridium sulfidigenes]|uniref:DUF1430 domain-containing protein n=1 Tax=Clostridium sulfidigenes TaxID=318464 RepID=UPI003F89D40A